jgi:hypothetical protein
MSLDNLPFGNYSFSVADGNKGASLSRWQLKAQNAARQKALASNANKLLKLAEELNKEVGAADFDKLTPAQLRKIASIEHLARDIKKNMSQSPVVALPRNEIVSTFANDHGRMTSKPSFTRR